MAVHPVKIQISLGICDIEDADQTGWMPRLIWVLTGRTGHFVGFVVAAQMMRKYRM